MLASAFAAAAAAVALTASARCDDWANSGECARNPAFMWTDCVEACERLGLQEPFAALDKKAAAGPPGNATVLELAFDGSTGYAPLHITLRPDLSPATVAAVLAAVGKAQGQPAAVFYRNEAVQMLDPGQCGDVRCGPYALVQGRMLDGLDGTPTEGQPLVRRGFVARIQSSADFLIALDDHSEWGHSFTVWGEMRAPQPGWTTLEAIVKLPYREQVGAGGTIMRLLHAELTTTGRTSNAAGHDTAESTDRRDHFAGTPPPEPEANLSVEL